MICLGIDLASRPRDTAACVLRFSGGEAHIQTLAKNLDDDDLLDLAAETDVIAIDAPFGWPEEFVELVTAHHAGRPCAPDWEDADVRRELRLRRTDRWVWARGFSGRPPLSVSTDLIAMPALRCTGLLGRLGVTDRTGGRVVEAYPAAALAVWTGVSGGYKGKSGASRRAELAAALEAEAPWLTVPPEAVEDDDNLDAMVTALIGRAHALGRTHPVPDQYQREALREGWIAVPREDTLAGLAYPS